MYQLFDDICNQEDFILIFWISDGLWLTMAHLVAIQKLIFAHLISRQTCHEKQTYSISV